MKLDEQETEGWKYSLNNNRRNTLKKTLMFWKNFSLGNTKEAKEISVFLLKAEISFKTVSQVSYKDEFGNNKIVRFYDKIWVREVTSFSNDPKSINFKFFAHSPNLKKPETVTLSISLNGEVVLSQVFELNMKNEFTGWTRLEG
jgi:hypothetical protein